MIRTSRRGALKAGAALGAVGAVPGVAHAVGAARAVVFDSRIAESAHFGRRTGGHRIDLAQEDARLWAGLRREFPAVSRVEGLTGWSDWISVRSELEARGFRLVGEAPVRAPLSARGGLHRWTMAVR